MSTTHDCGENTRLVTLLLELALGATRNVYPQPGVNPAFTTLLPASLLDAIDEIHPLSPSIIGVAAARRPRTSFHCSSYSPEEE